MSYKVDPRVEKITNKTFIKGDYSLKMLEKIIKEGADPNKDDKTLKS